MTLSKLNAETIERRKKEFDEYVKEMGYEIAKKIMLPTTGLKAVKEYIENYNDKKQN